MYEMSLRRAANPRLDLGAAGMVGTAPAKTAIGGRMNG